MNNAKIAIDNIYPEERVDRTPLLREQEQALLEQIEAIEAVSASEEWGTLKKYTFDGLLESLERQLMNEAQKNVPDSLIMARINGQLIWARNFADLQMFASSLRQLLEGVRIQLYGKTKED